MIWCDLIEVSNFLDTYFRYANVQVLLNKHVSLAKNFFAPRIKQTDLCDNSKDKVGKS